MQRGAGTGDMAAAEEARMALRFQTGDWETGTPSPETEVRRQIWRKGRRAVLRLVELKCW